MILNALQEMELEEIENMDLDSEETKEQFKIENLDQANWAFRKLAALHAKEQEVKRLAEAERQRINAFEERELNSIQRQREFFHSLLTEYATKEREKDPMFKAKTPYGSISFRKQQPKWEYNDDVLVQSLESIGRDDLIRIKKEPNKNEIKDKLVVTKKGEVIDPETGSKVEGVIVTPQSDKLIIKVEV
ncbi:hypothetical protein BSNK01_12460 [Bacillaceae bacterium]